MKFGQFNFHSDIPINSSSLKCALLTAVLCEVDMPKAIEFFETDFCDTLTIQNDQISHVKHVLAPLYMFFTLFGCWGVAPKGSRAQLAYAVFQPRRLKNGNHLAEVVRSKPGRRIYGENATYPPIWAYSRTLPQGVELLF